MSQKNRPYKLGERDRQVFIYTNGELAVRIENDADGNPIYVGKAKVGTTDGESKWQISFLEYDGNGFLDTITWPQDDSGKASTNYEFEWDERAAYTYS